MAQPRTYWQKRFEILEQRSNLRSQSHINGLAKQYRAAIKETEKDLAVFYNRLAANNELPNIAAAKKLLSANELADFKMSIAEYTRLAKENGITGDWTKTLENASLKHRISRLEAMKLQMEHHATQLMQGQLTGLEKFTASAYETAYYNGAFEIAKGTGIGKTLFQLDEKRINTVINRPWAADGRNFSSRVWGQHRPQLVQNLHRDLTRSLMRGEGPDKAIKAIAHDFDVSLSAAARLVQTEESYFSSVAQRDVFSDLDVEQYEIIATLDGHTSDICQDLDGKVFKMSEFEAGVTAPPFHVRCRTTTAPYFDDEVNATRAARDPETGQTVQVPADMKYQDWKDQYTIDPETGKTNAQLKAEQKAKEEAEAKARAEAERKAREEAEAKAKAEAERKAREQAEAKAKAEAEARAKAEAEAAQKAKEAEKQAYKGMSQKEAEDFLTREVIAERHIERPVVLDGISQQLRDEIVEDAIRFRDEFGAKPYSIINARLDSDGGLPIYAHSVGGGVWLNSVRYNKTDNLIKFYLDSPGWNPLNTTHRAIIPHELTHAMLQRFVENEKYTDKASLSLAKKIRASALKKCKMTAADISKNLSNYATTDANEFVAEAICEYMDSPTPRPLAKATREAIREIMGM